MTQTQTLYQLALKERELIRTKKELDEIPEAAQIVECRAKRRELKAKQDQVVELADEVAEKIARFEDEETKLLAKLAELQSALDHTTDHRVVTKVTRDMEGLVKREQTINQETDALLERQIKIDNLGAQVMDMLEKLDHKEHHLTEDFKVKGGEVKARMEALENQVKRLLAELPAPLQTRYAKIKAEKGGIGTAYLEGTHCSACHVEFQTGVLSKLRSGEPVTECPSCHRLFVTQTD
ncbi:MAG: zinc ribbon domain-containing protein [Coriobacteriales bacterium]